MAQITFVQEGKMTSQDLRGACIIEGDGSIVVSGGKALHREAAIVIARSLGAEVVEAQQLRRWKHHLLFVVCSHLPYRSQGLPALAASLQELQPIIESHRMKGAHVLWGMDANVCLGAAFDADIDTGLYHPCQVGSVQRERAELLHDFLLDHQLQASTFGSDAPAATWFPWGRGQDDPGRQIDYLCSSLAMTSAWVWDIVATKPSDYVPLFSHACLPLSRWEKQQQRKRQALLSRHSFLQDLS